MFFVGKRHGIVPLLKEPLDRPILAFDFDRAANQPFLVGNSATRLANELGLVDMPDVIRQVFFEQLL